MERVLFALVANRALAPSSKLAATSWVAHDVHLPGLCESGCPTTPATGRWTGSSPWRTELARGVFDQVAHLLNLEVDLIFFDTTSTYFETEQADEPVWRDEHGRRVEPDSPSTNADAPADGAGRRPSRRPTGAAGKAGFRSHGKSKDSRDDLPAGRGRDGRDPRRDPGAGVVLAGQHHATRR